MRRRLKRLLPSHEAIQGNRWLRPLGSTLLHPSLWHLNRHSAAGAVAVGLFCGLIPGPFQMLGAAFGCVVFRVNLPLALVTTLYTNPFTFVPLYILGFTIGNALMGGDSAFVPPPEFGDMGLGEWLSALALWTSGLGQPLFVGLIVLGSSLSLLGYTLVRAAWRIHLVRAWRRRQARRKVRP